MRPLGLLLLILGIVAIAAPGIRSDLPFLDGFDNASLWIAGASLLVIGAIIVGMTRDSDSS